MNTDLVNNNFVVLKNFISANEAKELADQFEQEAVLKNFVGDSQSPKSHARYNYRHFIYLLCAKTEEVSKIYAGKLLPTYSYARIYLEGGTLEPHLDRESCEVSITLCIHKDINWPIHIKKPDGAIASIELEPGDAAMYRGCIAEHWRDIYTGSKHTQVFLHYVDLEGKNIKHYFDKLVN